MEEIDFLNLKNIGYIKNSQKMEKQIENIKEILKFLNLDENDRISLINDVLTGDLVLSTKALQLMKQISSQKRETQKEEQIQKQKQKFEKFSERFENAIYCNAEYDGKLWVGLSSGEISVLDKTGRIEATFKAHDDVVRDLVVFNRFVYSCSIDSRSSVKQWNKEFKNTANLPYNHSGYTSMWVHNNQLILGEWYNKQLFIYKRADCSPKIIETDHHQPIDRIFSYGKYLCTYDSGNNMCAWDEKFNQSWFSFKSVTENRFAACNVEAAVVLNEGIAIPKDDVIKVLKWCDNKKRWGYTHYKLNHRFSPMMIKTNLGLFSFDTKKCDKISIENNQLRYETIFEIPETYRINRIFTFDGRIIAYDLNSRCLFFINP